MTIQSRSTFDWFALRVLASSVPGFECATAENPMLTARMAKGKTAELNEARGEGLGMARRHWQKDGAADALPESTVRP